MFSRSRTPKPAVVILPHGATATYHLKKAICIMVISRFVIGALGTMVIEKQAIVIKSDLE